MSGSDDALSHVREVLRDKWADIVERLDERLVNPFTVTTARGEKVEKYRRVARPLSGARDVPLGDLHETMESAKYSYVCSTFI